MGHGAVPDPKIWPKEVLEQVGHSQDVCCARFELLKKGCNGETNQETIKTMAPLMYLAWCTVGVFFLTVMLNPNISWQGTPWAGKTSQFSGISMQVCPKPCPPKNTRASSIAHFPLSIDLAQKLMIKDAVYCSPQFFSIVFPTSNPSINGFRAIDFPTNPLDQNMISLIPSGKLT